MRVDYVALHGAEFDRVWRLYRKRMTSLEWSSIFPELGLQTGYHSFDLMDADLGRVLNILKDEDPDASKYGFLPYMATHSRGSVGSLLASSYAERINSAANLILTKGNTLSPRRRSTCARCCA